MRNPRKASKKKGPTSRKEVGLGLRPEDYARTSGSPQIERHGGHRLQGTGCQYPHRPLPLESSTRSAVLVAASGDPMLPMKLGSSGLEKFGWLRRLKNSARNCKFTCSPRFVSLKAEKLNSLKLGPLSEFRPRLPKWRVPGCSCFHLRIRRWSGCPRCTERQTPTNSGTAKDLTSIGSGQ